jgi:hypothetical protein
MKMKKLNIKFFISRHFNPFILKVENLMYIRLVSPFSLKPSPLKKECFHLNNQNFTYHNLLNIVMISLNFY